MSFSTARSCPAKGALSRAPDSAIASVSWSRSSSSRLRWSAAERDTFSRPTGAAALATSEYRPPECFAAAACAVQHVAGGMGEAPVSRPVLGVVKMQFLTFEHRFT
jgi:hypothetical protein